MQHQEYWSKVDSRSEHGEQVTSIYQIHGPPLFAYLRMHTALREDAEDLLVDTFLAALENKYFLLLPGPAQRAWLWRVARNKLVDMFRKQRTSHLPLDDIAESIYLDETLAPEESMLRGEEYAELYAGIRKLPEMQQQVLRLRFVHGLRCAEIAAVLGRREGTIRSLLSRALNLLRTMYEHSQEV